MACKKQLLSLTGKRSFLDVTLPEPLGTVRMQSLTYEEEILIRNYLMDEFGTPVKGRERFAAAKRICMSVLDSDGNLMFGEEDVEAMANWPSSLVDTLMDGYFKLNRSNGLGDIVKNAFPAGGTSS